MHKPFVATQSGKSVVIGSTIIQDRRLDYL